MFGRDRQGTIEELVRMGKEFDFSVFAFHQYTVNGEVVSSTQVRRALLAGDIEKARAFLGRYYALKGTVIAGDRRGASIGFPTANIKPHGANKLIPARGVYLVGVQLDGKQRYGMMNIGVRPTMTDGRQQTIEVHLFDFAGDIYGKELTVTFLRRLRDERTFASVEELVAQLGKDKVQALSMLAELTQNR